MSARLRRAACEADPDFARLATVKIIYGAQDEWPWLQDHDARTLADEWLPGWLAMVGPDGPGRPQRGQGGLRAYVGQRLSALMQMHMAELEARS